MSDGCKEKALIFDIKRDCSEDGPGIRTTVFFKGCPLSCVWCHNPEGKDARPGLSFNGELCSSADCKWPCIRSCKAYCLKKGRPLIVDRTSCLRCDRCFDVCKLKALEPVGRWVTVEDLVCEILIDKPFFDSTGGGVTISGGEPTMQIEFISAFLQKLKEKGIHTAIETCGFFEYLRFKGLVLPFLDLIYFDLKLVDEYESLKYTGQSNKKIIENIVMLSHDAGIPVIPRIPLIPGITTTKKNLLGIGRFLKDLKLDEYALIPYNPYWQDKLQKLGIESEYQYNSPMDKKDEEECLWLMVTAFGNEL